MRSEKKYTSQTNPNPMTMMRLLGEKKGKIVQTWLQRKKANTNSMPIFYSIEF